jgi:hypothetical protein
MKDPDQEARFAAIQGSGQVARDSQTEPALVNAPFVITGYAENPHGNQISEAFWSFGR